jgi:dephospho-CoA kinase
MSRPTLVGITGGIGAGKSIICRIFQLFNVPVYDADAMAKLLMSNDVEIKKQIVKLFGESSYNEGLLNRKFIANKSFANPEILSQLNNIVHPAVAHDFLKWARLNAQSPYLIKEAALLFESGSYLELDHTIVVLSDLELRKERIQKRDPQRSKKQIEEIMGKQWVDKKKISLADFVIYNDERHMLIPEVRKYHDLFSQRV